MKKVILSAVAFFLAAMVMSAQESHAFEKGYRGNMSVGGDISVTKGWTDNFVGLTTSHGYSFGDGMYMGGGIGLNLEFGGDYVCVPLFFESRYNIVAWKLSPYVDCRVGFEAILPGGDGSAIAFMASPGVGIDYRRLSYRVGYHCMAGNSFKLHTISLSLAYNF